MRLDLLDITEDEAQGLAEIAQLDLAMARAFSTEAQAKVTTEPEVAAQLSRTYHRCTRSYRQTLALKSRLRRDMALARKHDAEFVDAWGEPDARARAQSDAAFTRRLLARGAVTRLIWNEAEPLEVQDLLENLEDDLDFFTPSHLVHLGEDLDHQIERLTTSMRQRLAMRRAKAAAKTGDAPAPEPADADSS